MSQETTAQNITIETVRYICIKLQLALLDPSSDCGIISAVNVENEKGAISMTFVITESCIRCKYTDCVEVCPVDCFYEGPNFLVINPDECIDCALCEPECPVNAIYSEDELPEDQKEFIQINAELSLQWPNISAKKDAPADAQQWDAVKDKKEYLQKSWDDNEK